MRRRDAMRAAAPARSPGHDDDQRRTGAAAEGAGARWSGIRTTRAMALVRPRFDPPRRRIAMSMRRQHSPRRDAAGDRTANSICDGAAIQDQARTAAAVATRSQLAGSLRPTTDTHYVGVRVARRDTPRIHPLLPTILDPTTTNLAFMPRATMSLRNEWRAPAFGKSKIRLGATAPSPVDLGKIITIFSPLEFSRRQRASLLVGRSYAPGIVYHERIPNGAGGMMFSVMVLRWPGLQRFATLRLEAAMKRWSCAD